MGLTVAASPLGPKPFRRGARRREVGTWGNLRHDGAMGGSFRAPSAALLVGGLLVGGCGLTLDLEPEPEPDAGSAAVDGGPGVDFGPKDGGPNGEVDARPTQDAGPPDLQVEPGDARTCTVERCNGIDDDCDGVVDDGYDRTADPLNCGECGNVCAAPGGVAICVAGRCALASCGPGRADCDDAPENGCEVDLSAPTTCGGCDRPCPASEPACVATAGGLFECVGLCAAPLISCDGACVDTQTSATHCGGCGRACLLDPHGLLSCQAGVCVVVDCGDGHRDCNGDPSDGCETLVRSDTHCGVCDRPCASGQTCFNGLCVASDAP